MSKESSSPDIQQIDPKERVSSCPECQYRDGFHISLYRSPTERFSEVILICPNCHRHFGLGWKVDMDASGLSS